MKDKTIKPRDPHAVEASINRKGGLMDKDKKSVKKKKRRKEDKEAVKEDLDE